MVKPTKYVQVKLKTGKPFYAIVESKNSKFTLYLPVNKDGDDKSRWSAKRKAYVTPKELVQNSLIVSEKPMIISLLYGWLVPATTVNKKTNAAIKAEHQHKRRR